MQGTDYKLGSAYLCYASKELATIRAREDNKGLKFTPCLLILTLSQRTSILRRITYHIQLPPEAMTFKKDGSH